MWRAPPRGTADDAFTSKPIGTARTVALYVTVQDEDGRLVTGLERDAFVVRDNGRPVAITQFSNDVQPITMVLLVDMSASMAHRYRQARDALRSRIEAFVSLKMTRRAGRWRRGEVRVWRRAVHRC